MVSAMVTVMTQVFFFDADWPQVKCLRPGRRWNRLPYDSPLGSPVNHCRSTPRLQAKKPVLCTY